MIETNPGAWSLWTLWLYGFALYCAGGFVWYWFRFGALERAAVKEGAGIDDVNRFNGALEGFPNKVYAKMLGKRRLEP